MNNDLRIKIKIDADNKELLITKGELKKLGNTADNSSKKTGGMINNLGKIGGTVGGIYAVERAMSAVVDAGFDYNASMEKSLQTLTIIEGSSQKAAASLEWVEEFAISTPYAFEEVKESFVKLRAYGIDPTTGALKTLGDTSAAMGKPIMAAVEAMADAVVGENERLKEFGIRAAKKGDEIKYSWTTASGEMKDAVASNNAQMIQSTLEAIFNEKYEGAMEAQAKTWEGATSNMEAAWDKLAGELTKPIFDSAKDGALDMTSLFNDLTDSIHKSRLEVTRLQDVGKSKNIADITYQLEEMKAELKDIEENGQGWWEAAFGTSGGAEAQVQLLTAGIRKAERQLVALNKAKKENTGTAVDPGTTAVLSASAIKEADNAHKKWIADAEAEADRLLGIWKTEEAARQKTIEDQAKLHESALGLITPELDKINNQYGDMYNVVKEIFSQEQLEAFYAVWGSEIDAINEKSKDNVATLTVDYTGAESQDLTAGLDDAARGYANISNAIADLVQDQGRYTKAIEETNRALEDGKTVTEDGTDLVAYKAQLETQHAEAQLSSWSNLAGAMAGAFDEGSSAAQALLTVQTALSVAAGITAVANAMAAGDGYTAVARGIAVAAALASFGLNLGGSGGGSIGSSADGYTSQSDSIEDNSSSITDRLDRQIDLLEVISLQGTAGQIKLDKAQETFVKDYQLSIDTMIESLGGSLMGMGNKGPLEDFLMDDGGMFSSLLDVDALMTDFDAIDFIGLMLERIEELKATSDIFSETGYDAIDAVIGDIQQAMTDYATTMTDVVGEMSDAADTFRDLYDNISGTTKYADIELAKAMEDVDALRGDQSYLDYLEDQILAISSLEDAFDMSIRNLLMSTDPADLAAQQEALGMLQDTTNMVFDNGVEDALNYLDSIELVGNSMANASDALRQLDDLYLGQYSSLSMVQKTAYANNAAYEAADIGGTTEFDAAKVALETAYKSATREEDYRVQFNNYAKLLEEQVGDSSNTDIVNAIERLGDNVEAIEEELARLRNEAVAS